MFYARAGEIYDKSKLIFMLGDDYSPSTRDNAITALLETFRYSPIGAMLKQGVPIPDGASFKYAKQGWNPPDAVGILYAFYKYAEETKRYTFTLRQLNQARTNYESKGVDPVVIFGLDPIKFKAIVQDIALLYPEYINVVFVHDLDNIILLPEKRAIDVLDIVIIEEK
jgi:phosphoadenosine phosphosulfate reductase